MSKSIRLVALVCWLFAAVAIIGGGVTWGMVTTQLSEENITVPKDSPMLAGAKVQDPFSAYAQAEIIKHHALAASEGKTYAELGVMVNEAKAKGDTVAADKFQQQRTTVMNGSFLRASLFTSVLAYGVSLLVIGLGVMFGLLGWALSAVGKSNQPFADSPTK